MGVDSIRKKIATYNGPLKFSQKSVIISFNTVRVMVSQFGYYQLQNSVRRKMF